jgi:hypothetical protein
MRSITTIRQKEQYNNHKFDDENTSNDSLLLMADSFEENAALLNIADDDSIRNHPVLSDDIPLRSRTSTLHCHVPDEKVDYSARNRLIVVLCLCISFMVIEIIGMFVCIEFNIKTIIAIYLGGILSNSTAIITDAAHMCIDAIGFLISLIAIYLARKRSTPRLSFGYARAGLIKIFCFFFEIKIH